MNIMVKNMRNAFYKALAAGALFAGSLGYCQDPKPVDDRLSANIMTGYSSEDRGGTVTEGPFLGNLLKYGTDERNLKLWTIAAEESSENGERSIKNLKVSGEFDGAEGSVSYYGGREKDEVNDLERTPLGFVETRVRNTESGNALGGEIGYNTKIGNATVTPYIEGGKQDVTDRTKMRIILPDGSIVADKSEARTHCKWGGFGLDLAVNSVTGNAAFTKYNNDVSQDGVHEGNDIEAYHATLGTKYLVRGVDCLTNVTAARSSGDKRGDSSFSMLSQGLVLPEIPGAVSIDYSSAKLPGGSRTNKMGLVVALSMAKDPKKAERLALEIMNRTEIEQALGLFHDDLTGYKPKFEGTEELMAAASMPEGTAALRLYLTDGNGTLPIERGDGYGIGVTAGLTDKFSVTVGAEHATGNTGQDSTDTATIGANFRF